MLQDLTVRTPRGSVDLVPYLRRLGVLPGPDAPMTWGEGPAAMVALRDRGYTDEEIARAVNSSSVRVREVLARADDPAPSVERVSSTDPAQRARQDRERLRAERVLDGDRWVHPDAPHGTPSGAARYGCQCVPCRAAQCAQQQRQRQARREAA